MADRLLLIDWPGLLFGVDGKTYQAATHPCDPWTNNHDVARLHLSAHALESHLSQCCALRVMMDDGSGPPR